MIAFFFHMTVILLLRKVQRGATNQKLLITNLSLAELFFIPVSTVYYFRLLWTKEGTLSYEITTVAFVAVALNCYFANWFLILDRTIAGLKPLQYRSIFTKGRVKVVAIALWGPILLIPIPYITSGFETFVRLMIILSLGMDVLMIINALFCYSVVFAASRKRQKTFRQTDGNRGVARSISRQRNQIFKVAIPVMLTFLIFVTLPDVVSLILTVKKIDPIFYRKILYTIPCLDIFFDPLLFLYQYPPLRSKFMKMLGLAQNGLDRSCSKSASAITVRSRVNSAYARNSSAKEQSESYDTRM